jgi:hypothetical protein
MLEVMLESDAERVPARAMQFVADEQRKVSSAACGNDAL